MGGPCRVGPGRHGDLAEMLAAGSVFMDMALGREGMEAHRAEKTKRGFVAAPVPVGPGARKRRIAVDAHAGLAEPGFHRQCRPLDAGRAPRAPHDFAARVGGVHPELSAQAQEMRGNPLEHPLDGPGVGEQAVDLPGLQPRVGRREGHRLGFEIPGGPIGKLAEGRMSHPRDDGAASQRATLGMLRFAMISRITSLVPAPMPQFCTPREQRAT